MSVKYGNTEALASKYISNEDGLKTLEIPISIYVEQVVSAGKTLDQIVAAVTGDSNDVAANYDRIKFTGSDSVAAHGVTYTLGDGHFVGQRFEIACEPVITTGTLVITITHEVGGAADGSDTITIGAARSMCLLRWNGFGWHALAANAVHS